MTTSSHNWVIKPPHRPSPHGGWSIVTLVAAVSNAGGLGSFVRGMIFTAANARRREPNP